MAACLANLLLSLLVVGVVASGGDVAKKVVHTKWWPPGSEKTAESVGIISHGFVYMTAMMEVNFTENWTFDLNASMTQIVFDVRDIARAAGVDLANLVDCLVNSPKGASGVARATFTAALHRAEKWARPALTFVEMPGEYQFTNYSASCTAALGPHLPKQWRHGSTRGMSAHGLLHMEGTRLAGASPRQEVEVALASIGEVISSAGGRGIGSLVDCTAFVANISHAASVRNAFSKLPKAPALTIAEAGLQDRQRAVSLRCVAAVGKDMEVERFPEAAAVGGLVFVSGQMDTSTKGLGAFQQLAKRLKAAGVGLSDVVNCLFYTKDQAKNFDLFNGFFQVFNTNHPPPPTRGELQGLSECSDCAVLAKCIAARPVSPTAAAAVLV